MGLCFAQAIFLPIAQTNNIVGFERAAQVGDGHIFSCMLRPGYGSLTGLGGRLFFRQLIRFIMPALQITRGF